MLSYLKKFAVDIFPSVAATVIGAYIVNQYVITKPGAGTPIAAVSTADSKGNGEGKVEAKAAPDAKPAETSNLPAPGVKARGISEKAIMEKTTAGRPTVVEKAQGKTVVKTEAKVDTKPDAKAAEAPAETVSVPPEPRRHQPAPREKEKIRVVLPSPVQPAPSASAPVAAAPTPAAPVETAVAPDERRDANDLARAAIERLRVNGEGSPRAPELARIPAAPRVDAPRVAAAPALRPPPPVMVSAPATGEPYGQASPQRPPYAANAETGDPLRPIPPAEIPVSRPLDLRAEAAEPSVGERTTAAAEEVLSTAKSLFHAVLPK
jgi:hypothetical protein